MYKGPIIDIHCHVGMEKEGIEERPGCADWWVGSTPEAMMMQKARGWIAKNKNAPQAMDMKSVPPLTIEILVEHMDEAGVEKAVIIGAKAYMRKSLTGKWKDKGYVWEVPNDYIAECCKKYPERFIGVLGVDPFNGRKEADEIKKYYEEYGISGGIKIFTPAGIAPNNKELCYPLYEKCLEYDIPVHVHTGGDKQHLRSALVIAKERPPAFGEIRKPDYMHFDGQPQGLGPVLSPCEVVLWQETSPLCVVQQWG